MPKKPEMNRERFLSATYKQLADRTGISSESWCRIFRGRSSPTLKWISSQSKSLKVSPAELAEWILTRIQTTSEASSEKD